jgi:Protein of unknown function (DUF3791)
MARRPSYKQRDSGDKRDRQNLKSFIFGRLAENNHLCKSREAFCLAESNQKNLMGEHSRKKDDLPLFLSFCIEQYKHAHAISGEEAMAALSNSGTLAYLERNYEPLHTQSAQWLVEEIDNYIARHQ